MRLVFLSLFLGGSAGVSDCEDAVRLATAQFKAAVKRDMDGLRTLIETSDFLDRAYEETLVQQFETQLETYIANAAANFQVYVVCKDNDRERATSFLRNRVLAKKRAEFFNSFRSVLAGARTDWLISAISAVARNPSGRQEPLLILNYQELVGDSLFGDLRFSRADYDEIVRRSQSLDEDESLKESLRYALNREFEFTIYGRIRGTHSVTELYNTVEEVIVDVLIEKAEKLDELLVTEISGKSVLAEFITSVIDPAVARRRSEILIDL